MTEHNQQDIARLNQKASDLQWQIERLRSTSGGATSGIGAPTSTPTKVGQTYVDLSTGSIYMAVGTSGAWNWGFIGAGALVDDYRVGLTSWYDASDSLTPTTNGSTLTAWNDKGSQLNHCTSLSGTPQYFENIQNGLPAAYFAGGEAINGTDKGDVAQPQTHFVVFKPTGWGTGAEQRVVEMYSNKGIVGKQNTTTKVQVQAGTNLVGEAIANDTTTIATAIFSGASSSIQINENAATVGNAGTNANGNYPQLGGVTSYFFVGYIMEWRVYDGALSTTNQATIRNFLNTKWAVY